MSEAPILVITTGGTIDKQYFDALSQYQITDTVVATLLEIARVTAPYQALELTRKDSLDLDESDRTLLRATIADSSHARIVVTHGTDTMTESAAALEAVGGKTIVLVGALKPARFAESDAPFNLGMAVATAQIAAPGIYITMNGTVFSARDAIKDREQGAFVRRINEP